MLLFKKKFIEAIRCGKKTQTIRLWNRCRMKAGQRSYIPGIGYILILSVDQVDLDRLTDDDALPDGFARASLLREELRSIYADELARGFQAFRIRFSVYPPPEQSRMKKETKRLKEERARTDRDRKDRAQQEHVDKTLAKLKRLADGH